MQVTARERLARECVSAPAAIERPYAAPPDVPADRAKALQDAFLATQKDPAYLEEAEKIGIDIGFEREGRARTRMIRITTAGEPAAPETLGAQPSASSA